MILPSIPPRLKRGVSRTSRNVRRDAVDADVSKTDDADADGEVVWSWRPVAGAKFAKIRCAYLADDGDNKVRLTEESAK